MLELRHVSKHFSGIPAVEDVSFAARPGEATGQVRPILQQFRSRK